jgi:probable F420-dependent oxidoreductase
MPITGFEVTMNLGRLGVFSLTDGMTSPESAAFAKRLEDWGYSVLWMGDGYGRDILIQCSWLLANTSKLILASGIASIYGRDAVAMTVSNYTLCEQSGGRFILGIGVSHDRIVEGRRGHVYGKPLTAMRSYLDSMDRVDYLAPPPPERPRVVLAALGPKMLALAGERTDGAMPFCVTPAHTAQARAILGPGKLLCPEQKLLLESDPDTARAIGRRVLARYLALDNYRNNLLTLGYTEDELSNGGSDRVVDDLVGWGGEAELRARVQAHWDAGADHVCILPIQSDPSSALPDARVLALLAPAITGFGA